MSNQREPYMLNEIEYDILREALLHQEKMNLVFYRFALNTVYFISSYRRSRKLRPEFMPKQLEDGNTRELTPEEHEQARKRIAEIKEQLYKKIGKKPTSL